MTGGAYHQGVSSDPTELARVLSHYDTGVVKRITPLRRGAGSSAKWIVACERGPFLLKRRPQGVDEAGLALIQWAATSAGEAGFPVPAVVPVGAGGAVNLRLDGRLYEMSKFVSSRGYDESADSAKEAGAMLARLHGWLAKATVPDGLTGVAGARRGYHRALRVQTDLVSIADRLGGEGAKSARALGAMYTLAAERAASAGVEGWPTQLIHGDWHPGNLLFDGPRIVGLLDFDSVRIGARALDLGYGCLQFSLTRPEGESGAWPAHADEGRLEAFFRGYDTGTAGVVSRGEVAALAWLMIEALIAEAVGPVAASGEFGAMDGASMLKMVESKASWLRDHHARISQLVG